MVCKITSTKQARRAGFTLVEFMVATALGTLLLAVVCWQVLFASRSFVAVANYLDLDQHSQQSLDKMSREIRQTDHVTFFSPTNVTFIDYDGGTLQYLYDGNARTLNRIKGGQTTTLLTGCDSLNFSIYQRTPISNVFEPYSTSTYTNAKLLEINWNCSRPIRSANVNTESIQSAKVVIRNH